MSVKMEGMREITMKIDGLSKPMPRTMREAVQHINGRMQRDPTKARGAFSAMATPGQRLAYWYKVSKGEAMHSATSGYIRSGRTFRGWKTRIEKGGRLGIIENRRRWAGYVQGEAQQPFHKASRYPQDEKVVEEEADTVLRLFSRDYARQLAK